MELVVLRVSGSWSVMVDGKRHGRYDYEVDAVEAALKMSRAVDGASRVLVQARFGELRPLEEA